MRHVYFAVIGYKALLILKSHIAQTFPEQRGATSAESLFSRSAGMTSSRNYEDVPGYTKYNRIVALKNNTLSMNKNLY
jgi:hypothetical protein